MNAPNYTEAINALAAQQAADRAYDELRAAQLTADAAAEAAELMRPLTAVMESHPDIQLINENLTSPGGGSVYRKVYRRHPRHGLGPCIVAVTLDPPGVSKREIYIQTDKSSIAYLSTQAVTRGRAVVARADALIPMALEWCAKLIAPQP